MTKAISLLFLIIFFAAKSFAQTYLEPVAGFQTDLNNNSRFKQINIAAEISIKTGRRHELILQLQKTWPFSWSSSDSSFSVNPALPLYSPAEKKVRASSISLSVGNRINVLGAGTKNIFSLLLYAGYTFQKFKTTYQYDKSNYIILNPDRSLTRSGIFVSGGAEYMRQLKNGRLFMQLIASTPPARKEFPYPSSFKMMAPWSLNIGYSIPIKRKKDEK